MNRPKRGDVLRHFALGLIAGVAFLAIVEGGKEISKFFTEYGIQFYWLIPVVGILIFVLLMLNGSQVVDLDEHFDDILAGVGTLLVVAIISFLAAFLPSQESGFNWFYGSSVGLLTLITCAFLWLRMRTRAPKDFDTRNA